MDHVEVNNSSSSPVLANRNTDNIIEPECEIVIRTLTMNPDLSTQSYLLNHYHRQDVMKVAQRERLVAALPRRTGRMDVLIMHLGRSMIAIGQRLQRQSSPTIEEASLSYPLPAFDNR
jgi:hypothetical protein